MRRQTGLRKFGHAGTLDPAATGLMIILVGAATKQATRLLGLDKIYVAELTLGALSTTGDREGEITPQSNRQPTQAEVEAALKRYTGRITQTPPAHSAIKVGGQRAYQLARAGKPVDMPSRQVTVHALKLLDYAYPIVRLEAHVSSGTYIRTLAEGIGAVLGVGAYLSALRRTQIGDYTISAAAQLQDIDAASIRAVLRPH